MEAAKVLFLLIYMENDNTLLTILERFNLYSQGHWWIDESCTEGEREYIGRDNGDQRVDDSTAHMVN